jgi:uridine phosphorylase
MEGLIACGARVFFGLGWAGSLQPSAPIGSMLIPTTCIREEGTSFHYLDGSVAVQPDVQMVDLLQKSAAAEKIQLLSGLHWTTDAPYRELISKIKAFAEQGVLGVDMETSAMYALGQFRGVRVCNVLVVSDELWQEWRGGFYSPELRQATERAERLVLRCLESNALTEWGRPPR